MSPSERQQEKHQERSKAQWVVLAASALLILAVTGFILYDHFVTGGRPAVVEVQAIPGSLRQTGSIYHLDVIVRNSGSMPAKNVMVSIQPETDRAFSAPAQLLINFLPAGEHQKATISTRQPIDGRHFTYTVGFLQP